MEVTVVLLALATLGKPTFSTISTIPGLEESTEVCGMSADGRIVAGYATGDAGKRAIQWNAASGTKSLGDLSWTSWRSVDPGGSYRPALTFKPSTIRWARSVGVLGGVVQRGAYRNIQIWCASADGSVLAGSGVGKEGPEALRWTKGGAPEGLGDLKGGGFFSKANNVSADGSIVVGMSQSFDGPQAFVWTKAKGIVGLGFLNDAKRVSEALCVSADGSAVGGFSTGKSGWEGFLWTKSQGMRSVRDLLLAAGVAGVSGWRLDDVVCISDDGTALAGNGVAPSGKRQGWVVSLLGNATANRP